MVMTSEGAAGIQCLWHAAQHPTTHRITPVKSHLLPGSLVLRLGDPGSEDVPGSGFG